MKLQLLITVTYQPNGVPEQALSEMLGSIAEHAASVGMFTGETEATVVEWDYAIIEPE